MANNEETFLGLIMGEVYDGDPYIRTTNLKTMVLNWPNGRTSTIYNKRCEEDKFLVTQWDGTNTIYMTDKELKLYLRSYRKSMAKVPWFIEDVDNTGWNMTKTDGQKFVQYKRGNVVISVEYQIGYDDDGDGEAIYKTEIQTISSGKKFPCTTLYLEEIKDVENLLRILRQTK